MKRITGALWGVLICLLITFFFGCKTKKTILAENIKRTYDSAQVVKEQADVKYSLVDTSRIDENTTLIREYIFDTPYYGKESCLTHDTNVKQPMVEIKADGSVIIHHGLKSIKEQKESRRNEKKGLSERKDSTSNKDTYTKVATSENTKKTNKQIDKVQIAQPFCWWQQIGVFILLCVVVALLYVLKKPYLLSLIKRLKGAISKR